MAPHSPIPLIGNGPTREEVVQARIGEMYARQFLAIHAQLVPFRVAHGYQNEDGMSFSAMPEAIAAEADQHAKAAMEKLGFVMQRENP